MAVLGTFLDARAVDEVHVFLAPKLIGGAEALTPIGGLGIAKLNDVLTLCDCTCEPIGNDFYWHGYWNHEPT